MSVRAARWRSAGRAWPAGRSSWTRTRSRRRSLRGPVRVRWFGEEEVLGPSTGAGVRCVRDAGGRADAPCAARASAGRAPAPRATSGCPAPRGASGWVGGRVGLSALRRAVPGRPHRGRPRPGEPSRRGPRTGRVPRPAVAAGPTVARVACRPASRRATSGSGPPCRPPCWCRSSGSSSESCGWPAGSWARESS